MLRWISIQEQRGYEVNGSALYRSYAEQMQLIVADYTADDVRELPIGFSPLQEQALREYRQGETFVGKK